MCTLFTFVHDVTDSKNDMDVNDTMTSSETKLDLGCSVFEDPLFHSISVIEGSEKRRK